MSWPVDFVNQLVVGDVLEALRQIPDDVVQCCVTSPPYWGLRDYGIEGQIGLEKTPEEYVAKMVEIFREVRRVLRPDGTLWLNLGDSYMGSGMAYGHKVDDWTEKQRSNRGTVHWADNKPPSLNRHPILKPKDLIGIPWRVAFALQSDGWWLRQDIIWAKPNPMPESVKDRCTKAHEYIFLLTRSATYYYELEAIREDVKPWNNGKMAAPRMGANRPRDGARDQNAVRYKEIKGANRRSVWTIPTEPYSGAHFATFPTALIEPCILAGSRPSDIVLDPFGGSGTTAFVARKHGRRFIHIDLKYHDLAAKRLAQQELITSEVIRG